MDKEQIDISELPLERLIEQAIATGVTIKQLKGITDNDMEGLYTLAHRDYQAGQYDRAFKLFRVLSVLDQYNVKYVLGHAAVQRKLGNHDHAILLYSCAYLLDSNDVRVPYYAGVCHMEVGNYTEAESAFYLASGMIPEKAEHEKYVDQAASLLALVQQKTAANANSVNNEKKAAS